MKEVSPIDKFREERHRHALEDGSGRSPHGAAAQVSGETPYFWDETTAPEDTHDKKLRPTGHVRGFSDGEQRDGEKYPSDGLLTVEQREVYRQGLARVRGAIPDLAINNIIARAEEHVPINPDDVERSQRARDLYINAALRSYFDKRAAKISEQS